jgi:light-regulated signal transduction histidine kinase (bacteriophytochrome)
MFKRLHSEAEFEGTGIGLAVCKKIVDYYNGNIWFDSEIGKGTTIHFSLPKRKAEDTDMYAPNILSTLAPDLFSVN